MADQMQPRLPERKTSPEAEMKRFEAENEGLEVIESLPEEIEAKDEKPTESLKKKLVGEIQKRKEERPEELVKEDVAERIETIVNNFVKSAAAANFDDEKVEKILKKAEMYIAKGYPQIADEVHDRILKERDERISGKID